MNRCYIVWFLIVSGEGQDLLSGTGQTYMHLKLVYANFIIDSLKPRHRHL